MSQLLRGLNLLIGPPGPLLLCSRTYAESHPYLLFQDEAKPKRGESALWATDEADTLEEIKKLLSAPRS